MRAINFYICLFILLLSAGNSYCAPTNRHSDKHNTSKQIHKNHKSILHHKNHVGTLINDIDVDLEEDFSVNDNVKTVSKNKFISLKYNLSSGSYLNATNFLVLNQCSKRFKISSPLSGKTTPIYISLGVLRI